MKIKICVGSNCILLGSMGILDQIEDLEEFILKDKELYSDEKIEIEATKCLGMCKDTDEKLAPVVIVEDQVILNATGQEVMEIILSKMLKN